MSVARCREITARLRAAGITVYEWPGWESRGNGQTARYEGGLNHHTGTSFGAALPGTAIGNVLVHGRPDLPGPLCNYAGNADGSLTLIAAHPANHAGASGGRSMGPLPTATLFNPRMLGLEIVYPGTVPMRDAQYRAALVWSRVVTEVCGHGDIQRARAHAETSITGKWDPGDAPGRTINMVAFRAAALITKEDDMQADERQWLKSVHDWLEAFLHGLGDVGGGVLEVNRHAYERMGVLRAVATLAPSPGPTGTGAPLPVLPELGGQLPLVELLHQLAADVAEMKTRPLADVDEVALAAELEARGWNPASAAEVKQIVLGAFTRAGQTEGGTTT